MDILSHGLWAAAPFYRKSKKRFGLAFLVGILPDLIAFAPHTLLMILGPERHPIGEPPPLTGIHPITFSLYNITHSFIIFAAVFFFVFLWKKKPMWELWGWGFHVLTDIPTHTSQFFPTPFLWPFSSFSIDGFSWGQRWFILLNYSLLLGVYLLVFLRRRKQVAFDKNLTGFHPVKFDGGDDGT